jgi:hypothetical protein
MKDCIKSKFTKDTIYWTILPVVFISIFSIFGAFVGIKKNFLNDISILGLFLSILIGIGMPVLMIYVLKIRYYIITDEQLKYYSFWHPFGKILYFNNYIGKIITTETGSDGSYEVVYLVDRQNRTAFKLMGLHYKNFDEIIDAIPLKKIRFSSTAGRYFKLLFSGKIKVEKKNKGNRRKNKNAERRVNKIIYIMISIGLACFVLSMIVKILSKLMSSQF